MSKRKYRPEKRGPAGWSEWIAPRHRDYRVMCCDCGLVHEMQFTIGESDAGRKNTVLFRVRRNARATAAARRKVK